MHKYFAMVIGGGALITACFAAVIPRSPLKSEICTTWVGFSSEAVDFYRVVLGENRGLFASSFSGEMPKLYRIDSWELGAKGELNMTLSGISTNSYPIVVDGKATFSRIVIKIHGPKKDWEDEVVLYREQIVENRLRALESAMRNEPK